MGLGNRNRNLWQRSKSCSFSKEGMRVLRVLFSLLFYITVPYNTNREEENRSRMSRNSAPASSCRSSRHDLVLPHYASAAVYVTPKIVSASHFLKAGLSLYCLKSSV